MSKDRLLLAELIAAWVQSHTAQYTLVDGSSDQEITAAGINFGWAVKEQSLNVDLLSLLNAMDDYVADIRQRRKIDGMFCCKCKQFYDFAEANQEDGSMICFSCRRNPYV